MPIASAAFLFMAGAASGFSPSALWSAWPQRRFVATSAPCLRHAELVERLFALEARYPGRLKLEEVGRSVQGRKIHLVTLGSGPRRILLWSQMHGDEPSATPALLDLADTLLASDEPEPRAVLEGLTLLMVPMLNPDGAERYARRNAQAIDINRDALHLATPEGRLLKALRDRLQPELGFNLHDQNRRTTVGDTGVLSTISLLAVSGDREGTLTPGRARAKRVCSAIARTLEPFVPGGIGRYDEDWNPRAFGDNVTAWGTPVVLIESGGIPPGRPLTDLTRLNYVALVTVLHGLVRDDLRGESPELYEGLKRNDDGSWTDVLLAGGRVWQPWAGEPYRADVAFDVLDDDPLAASCAEPGWPGASRIREVGDGRLLGSARRLDVAGRLLAPAFTASVRGLDARSWLTAETLVAAGRLGVAPPRAGTSRPPSGPRRWRTRTGSSGPRAAFDRGRGRGAPAEPPRGRRSARDAVLARARVGARRAHPRLVADPRRRPPARRAPRRAGRGGPGRGLLPARGRRTRAPRSSSCDPREDGALDAARLDLEAVFIDGREPAGSAVGMALWTDPQIPELGPNVQRAHGPFAAAVGRFIMGIRGWRVEGEFPNVPRMVLIVAPHTSNWDFPTGVWVKLAMRMGGRFVGKHTLFRGPLGVFMRWLGGVPVDRTAAAGFVEETARVVRESERMTLVVAPEGTRKRSDKWKSGFYRIAVAAGVPIFPVGFDYRRKVIRFDPLFHPTGDYERDLAELQSHFDAGMALKPENYGS